MSSLGDYENLKEDFNCLLMEGGSFLDEDEFLIDLMSKSNNSKSVLQIVRSLKDEGNSLFRKGEIEEALEKYGYAGVVLVRCKFEKEEDKLEFVNLAICILLNSTACFSKQNEFVHVGKVCSIILEYSPNNVKALYRRALAAVNLEKLDWAYWDLLLALHIEPKNREVIREFEKVKKAREKAEVKDFQKENPIGLGIGLSATKKRPKRQLGNPDAVRNIPEVEEDCSTAKKLCDRDPEAQVKGMKNSLESSMVKDIGAKEKIKESSTVKDIEAKGKIEGTLKDAKMEKVVMDTKDKVSNSAEPKYRFTHCRRSGSSIAISKRDYQFLLRGKSIQCFNSKFGSPMTIRVVKVTKDMEEKRVSNKSNEFVNQPDLNKELSSNVQRPNINYKEDDLDMKNVPILSKKRKATGEVHKNQAINATTMSRVSNFEPATSLKHHHQKDRRRAKGKSKKVDSKTKNATRKRRNKPHIASQSVTDFVCACRFQLPKKRKISTPHDPRKKLLYDPYLHYVMFCECYLNSNMSCCMESNRSCLESSFSVVHPSLPIIHGHE